MYISRFISNGTSKCTCTVNEGKQNEQESSTCSSEHYKLGVYKQKSWVKKPIGPLHDPVTWYKIKYTGEQVAQWDLQNKATCTSPP